MSASGVELGQAVRELRVCATELEACLDRGADPTEVAAKEHDLFLKFERLRRLMAGDDEHAVEDVPLAPYRALSDADRAEKRQLARMAKGLTRDLRAKDFTDGTLREAAGGKRPDGAADEVLRGERMVSWAFDVASYATLDPTDAKAVTWKAVTEATRRSGNGTKLLVSAAKYLLGVSPANRMTDLTSAFADFQQRAAELLPQVAAAPLDRLVELDDLSGTAVLRHTESPPFDEPLVDLPGGF
ncbi:hypothetical protein ABZT04_10420 [Streptomyces sp. NPDC005492]|uniref:hypothetical protein n=1 Tax=Streptomyces sp. NPDC005492 TaxID=3156883 RepID=UPI0033B3D7F7